MRENNRSSGDIEMEEMHDLLGVNNKKIPRQHTNSSSKSESTEYYSQHSSNETCCGTCVRLVWILLIVVFAFIIGSSSTSYEGNSFMNGLIHNFTVDTTDGNESDNAVVKVVLPTVQNNDSNEVTLTPEVEEKDKNEESKEQPPKDEETKVIDNAIIEKWGKWKFYDGGADTRPKEDYCAKYPNRDVPEKEFPKDAWQADAV